MTKPNSPLFLLLLLGFLLFVRSLAAVEGDAAARRTYIVHVAKFQMPAPFQHHENWYAASLRSISDIADTIYTYSTAIHGFSARLTAAEAETLSALPGILSVLPEQRYELHTTRTPLFLGLGEGDNLAPKADTESDVIVGVLDTGVWPERRSYDDTGMGEVPAGWKGECEAGTNFTSANCNRKLIGARFFSKGYEAATGPVDEDKESKSPRDDDGHGTHTSSTAAGAEVEGAGLFGFAEGSARGMAKNARVAVYKVCWTGGCFSSDILAAMDRAIVDGVDVLSLSLGGSSGEFHRDSIAIGAFAAAEKGILVSCSAGNSGPSSESLSNAAPWITTVGAGTIDRDFPATVSLGNGKNYTGVSLFNYKNSSWAGTLLPFVYARNVSNATNSNLCMTGTLDDAKVAGKIVLCDRGINARVQKGLVVKKAGGAGMVLANSDANGEELVADAHLLPASAVGEKAGDEIRNYVISNSNPTVTIHFEGTKVEIQPAPVVAAFSSRGPNPVVPNILKPDIIAPGVNILAGWTGAVGPTGLSDDDRHAEFNIISGTSMSCPHVSGLAAYVKSRHMDWSPAAIRSALMTTAYVAYKDKIQLKDAATGQTATPFDYGAGHVNPTAALDPGLVYDLTTMDYLDFLCALNYTTSEITQVARKNFTCDVTKKYSVLDLNYPSFAAVFDTTGGGAIAVKFTRTVTNVAGAGSYKVSVSTDSPNVKVSVEPETLTFNAANEKKSYTVTVTGSSGATGTSSFGRLVWSDGKRDVGSPMAFTWA